MAIAPRSPSVLDLRSPAGWACWALVGAAVLVQIVYPLTGEPLRTQVTVLSVLVFAAASLADAARRHGTRGALVLLVVAGGGGLAAEAVGVATGLPFGAYSYTGTLGPQLLGVPAVVPLAWVMMAWPALVVGRALGRGRVRVVLVGAAALATWDLFLDPQMVDAGHWTWADPVPALPLVPEVPLSNYAGWLLVSLAMVAALHRFVDGSRSPNSADSADGRGPSGPAAALYLWTYGSSVVAHLAFFGLPGSALVGGIGMGLVAVPFARVVWDGLSRPGRAGARPARSGRTR